MGGNKGNKRNRGNKGTRDRFAVGGCADGDGATGSRELGGMAEADVHLVLGTGQQGTRDKERLIFNQRA
jgi:hypothetical protein